jgi:hypothetical protein
MNDSYEKVTFELGHQVKLVYEKRNKEMEAFEF